MARRREVPKRPVLPDPKFHDPLVSKFVNCMMKHGKKSAAEKAFYQAIDQLDAKGAQALGGLKSGLEVFKNAIENVKPILEVKSRRLGGSNYQVPIEVRSERKQALAIRWLIEFARERQGNGMSDKLASEFLDAANKRGGAMKRREDVHKMAEANKAFAHFRW